LLLMIREVMLLWVESPTTATWRKLSLDTSELHEYMRKLSREEAEPREMSVPTSFAMPVLLLRFSASELKS
jgi:hypothetical protein